MLELEVHFHENKSSFNYLHLQIFQACHICQQQPTKLVKSHQLQIHTLLVSERHLQSWHCFYYPVKSELCLNNDSFESQLVPPSLILCDVVNPLNKNILVFTRNLSASKVQKLVASSSVVKNVVYLHLFLHIHKVSTNLSIISPVSMCPSTFWRMYVFEIPKVTPNCIPKIWCFISLRQPARNF